MKQLTRFASLFVFLALLPPVTTAQSMSGWQRDNLVGSVRSMQVEHAMATEVNGKLVESSRQRRQRTTYNERGSEVEQVTFDPAGFELSRKVTRYDSEGRLAGYGDLQDRFHSTMEYDGRGNLIEERGYDGDVIKTRIVHKYDDNRREIEELRFSDGASQGRSILSHNAAGQLTEVLVYNGGKLTRKYLATYNAAGRPVKEEFFGYESPGEHSTNEYSYDDSGRMIEAYMDNPIYRSKLQTQYGANGRVAQNTTLIEYKQPQSQVGDWKMTGERSGRVTFSYNDREQKVEEAHYEPDGALLSKTVFTYDKDGKLIEDVDKYVTGERKTSYEYDSHGNWVKKTVPYSDQTGHFISIEYRVITYY